MNITCSQCDADVPEGALACPKCKAGIGTVVLGKKRSLTRSLIAKAVEMRTSIPWATDSAVVMVDDGTGRSKRRSAVFAGAVVALLVAGGAAGAFYFSSRSDTEPKVELASVEVSKSEPEPAPPRPAAKPAVARTTPPAPKPASAKTTTASSSANASASAKKAGTLTVDAHYRGKSVPAKVLVNGEDKGNTPVSVALGAGKYTVKILKTGYISAKLQDVQVDPGRNTALKIDLKK